MITSKPYLLLLFVGNIKKHKGLKTLLLAYIEAKKEGLIGNLLIVGNQNNFKTKDEEVIKILKDSKNEEIKFTGYVDNKELKKLIAEAKVLVQPSLYEGFGIPPLEALKLGTATVVSDIEVFKEIYEKMPVKYFKSDDIIDLKEKILKVFIEQDTIEVEYNYKYNYENVAKKIYQEIIN